MRGWRVAATVDDRGDGTYGVRIAMKLMATVQLYVQMDKNLGHAGELGPLLLTFTDDAAGAPTAPVEGAVAGAGKVPPLAI